MKTGLKAPIVYEQLKFHREILVAGLRETNLLKVLFTFADGVIIKMFSKHGKDIQNSG